MEKQKIKKTKKKKGLFEKQKQWEYIDFNRLLEEIRVNSILNQARKKILFLKKNCCKRSNRLETNLDS